MRKVYVAIGAPLSLFLVGGMSPSLNQRITASDLIAGKACNTAVAQQLAQEEPNDSNMSPQPGDANSDINSDNSDQSGSPAGDESNNSSQANPPDDNSGESPQMSGNPDDSNNPDQNEQNPEDQQNQQNPDDQNQSNSPQP
ncbi:MAG: hypothetical protein JO166_21860 [Deltaproteobacteria bacterium]|nr:hypothetical protein [Deltaproteobacteria bacterium]